MSTKIPDGWLDYSPFGRPIANTQIIPVKTPLKAAFNGDRLRAECPPYKVAKEEEFTPTQLVTRLKEQFGKKLCAVIDLTFTKRYYNSKELFDLGVKHAKVKCPGQEIPSEDIFSRFAERLSDFLKECDEHSLVAVHCTHGLNRTGYLVCRYLIEKQGFDPSSVIRDFVDARGYEIERQNYIKHLMDGCPRLPASHGHSEGPRQPYRPPRGSSSYHRHHHARHTTPTYDGSHSGHYRDSYDTGYPEGDWQEDHYDDSYTRDPPGRPQLSHREHSWRRDDARASPREPSWRGGSSSMRGAHSSSRASPREPSWSHKMEASPREYHQRTYDGGYSDAQQWSGYD